jgi:hypothetical protein
VAAFVIAQHVSAAEEIGAAASVIVQRVSVAKKSESAPSGASATVQEFRRHSGNRDARPLAARVPALSVVRKLGRMSGSGFSVAASLKQRRLITSPCSRRAKTHAPDGQR